MHGDLSNLLGHIISWHQYIDNVLLFWSGTKDELLQFINSISVNSFNLKFTMECDQQKITFLDLEISIDKEEFLCSSLFRKPSAENTILHATSAHPKSLLKSITYSQ